MAPVVKRALDGEARPGAPGPRLSTVPATGNQRMLDFKKWNAKGDLCRLDPATLPLCRWLKSDDTLARTDSEPEQPRPDGRCRHANSKDHRARLGEIVTERLLLVMFERMGLRVIEAAQAEQQNASARGDHCPATDFHGS